MNNKMRVWWNPQVGSGAYFYIPVNSVEEARKYMDILAAYDIFQFNHNIKPDCCNTCGLEMWDENEKEWSDWFIDDGVDYYDDVDDYINPLNNVEEFDNFSKELLSQVTFD